MSFAIIMLRSTINCKPKAKKTLQLLNLNRINHCVVVPSNEYYAGMLQIAKDYITWGEVDGATVELLINKRGGEVSDKDIADQTNFENISAFSQAVASDKASLKELENVEKVFRLHPPRRGHGGIKKTFNLGGALGYRGKEINTHIAKMMPEE